MLYFIGLGLWDEKDITLKGLEIAKSADKIYLEEYTSILKGSTKEKMEELIGKEITLLERGDLEQHPDWMDDAKEENVVLLVGGDPLVATTHSDLMMRCWEKGIETKVIHNTSILSAVGECGLQLYKFGKTATITYWEENYKPVSFYEVMMNNYKQGLHTLLLLDIKTERQMTPNEAIGVMKQIDSAFGDREIVTMSRVGGDIGIMFGKADVLEKQDHGRGLHILIAPGDMHVMEKSFLSHFRKD